MDLEIVILTAALFTVAKIWKQPKCPLMNEWIKKMWCIYTMEYYSAIKKNEFLLFVMTWMEFEGIMLSEISQTERQIPYDLIYIWSLEKNKLMYTENR